jgi:hypothetical protein
MTPASIGSVCGLDATAGHRGAISLRLIRDQSPEHRSEASLFGIEDAPLVLNGRLWRRHG